jgi:hypothetical protein
LRWKPPGRRAGRPSNAPWFRGVSPGRRGPPHWRIVPASGFLGSVCPLVQVQAHRKRLDLDLGARERGGKRRNSGPLTLARARGKGGGLGTSCSITGTREHPSLTALPLRTSTGGTLKYYDDSGRELVQVQGFPGGPDLDLTHGRAPGLGLGRRLDLDLDLTRGCQGGSPPRGNGCRPLRPCLLPQAA